jgi:putative membrane protein
MRTKTILIIIFTVIITVFLMMNTDAVEFDYLFGKGQISKLLVVGVCTFIGFILGYWAGRPKTVITTYDDKFDDHGNRSEHKPLDLPKDGLSEEDREYIS